MEVYTFRKPSESEFYPGTTVKIGFGLLADELGGVEFYDFLIYRGRLIGVFPNLENALPLENKGIEPVYFFLDLTDFYLDTSIKDLSYWREFLARWKGDQAAIQAYRDFQETQSGVKKENIVSLNAAQDRRYCQIELNKLTGMADVVVFGPKDLLGSGGFLKKVFRSSDERYHRIILPAFPTVYLNAAEIESKIARNLYYGIGLYNPQVKGRGLIAGPGCGYEAWISAGINGQEVFSAGINPFEAANTRASARIGGFDIQVKVHDNIVSADGIPAYPDELFDWVWWNMPTFCLSGSCYQDKSLKALWDNDYDGQALKRFSAGLGAIWNPLGRAAVWNLSTSWVEILREFRKCGLRASIGEPLDVPGVIYYMFQASNPAVVFSPAPAASSLAQIFDISVGTAQCAVPTNGAASSPAFFSFIENKPHAADTGNKAKNQSLLSPAKKLVGFMIGILWKEPIFNKSLSSEMMQSTLAVIAASRKRLSEGSCLIISTVRDGLTNRAWDFRVSMSLLAIALSIICWNFGRLITPISSSNISGETTGINSFFSNALIIFLQDGLLINPQISTLVSITALSIFLLAVGLYFLQCLFLRDREFFKAGVYIGNDSSPAHAYSFSFQPLREAELFSFGQPFNRLADLLDIRFYHNFRHLYDLLLKNIPHIFGYVNTKYPTFDGANYGEIQPQQKPAASSPVDARGEEISAHEILQWLRTRISARRMKIISAAVVLLGILFGLFFMRNKRKTVIRIMPSKDHVTVNIENDRLGIPCVVNVEFIRSTHTQHLKLRAPKEISGIILDIDSRGDPFSMGESGLLGVNLYTSDPAHYSINNININPWSYARYWVPIGQRRADIDFYCIGSPHLNARFALCYAPMRNKFGEMPSAEVDRERLRRCNDMNVYIWRIRREEKRNFDAKLEALDPKLTFKTRWLELSQERILSQVVRNRLLSRREIADALKLPPMERRIFERFGKFVFDLRPGMTDFSYCQAFFAKNSQPCSPFRIFYRRLSAG